MKTPTTEWHDCGIHEHGYENECLLCEIDRLRKLAKQGEAVVEDFLPNIANCALQDYGRLNDFLIEAGKL